MGVFFHILSAGIGSGASRTSRYIAERDRDPTREGTSPRALFSQDQDGLSYRKADRILDPDDGRPEKNDLIHFSIMITEKDFDELGGDEKERLKNFREVIRNGVKGMSAELNVEDVTWVAGIHRNTEQPHAHVVMHKDVIERGTNRPRRIGRIPRTMLPHREMQNGREILVNGPIGDKFVAALTEQQDRYLKSKDQQKELNGSATLERRESPIQTHERSPAVLGRRQPNISLEHRQISFSWNDRAQPSTDGTSDLRIALGKRLEFQYRLAFAEAWHERAVQYGNTYRFEVMDQSTGEERKLSELDVRRRAAARATHIGQRDHYARNDAIDSDLATHNVTLAELHEAREAKIAALGMDVSSLRGTLAKIEQRTQNIHELSEKRITPLMTRETLAELQAQSVKLNLADRASELENLRRSAAHEHHAPTRTDKEAATLVAQLNVARADLMSKDARLKNFEASVHLTPYEVNGDRWSLGALDKQIDRRREDSKLIPERAARLDLRSLARLNYSSAAREEAAADVHYLTVVRSEIVRRIEERRAPLITDRELSREMVDVLEHAHNSEERIRSQKGRSMPEPEYERFQINSLESSAEILRDTKLLKEVHDWERNASRNDSEINWEGRAVAREITSQVDVQEAKERLEHFLESKRVASLNLGNHRTGTLREVQAHTLTEYLARAIESREMRDYRHTIKLAAKEHHGRLVDDFQKASEYHEAARELVSEARHRNPQFTDKERINLEIYAERQDDPNVREQFLSMSGRDVESRDREMSWVMMR